MMRLLALIVFCWGWTTTFAADNASFPLTRGVVKSEFRIPLREAGQSGVCVQGDKLFLTVHAPLPEKSKGDFIRSADIVGQCFDKHSGRLLWEVDLPGTHAGIVLESWHDATSLLPVANEKYVLFHNLNGMLGCYTHDGKEVWRRNWQAPDPDIKNGRMWLHDERVIVALPSERIAVAASDAHPALPYYQLQAIELATGKTNWTSPVLLSHATQYSLDTWRNKPVIVASILDLSHWKFKQGSHGYLISLQDGQPLQTFDLPSAIPHQKNQLLDNLYLVAVKDNPQTKFQLIDPTNSAIVKTFESKTPDAYYAWNGQDYALSKFAPQFTDKILRGDAMPTPSTMHVAGGKIYYWRYDTNAIGCVDPATGKTVLVEAPLQVLEKSTVWNEKEFQFTLGILNSADKVVNQRVGTVRGNLRGGFGHVNPAWPIQRGNRLLWQGGAGVLFCIDVSQPFSPTAIDWLSIDPLGNAWTFGEPGFDDDHIYVRSQRELVKFSNPQSATKTDKQSSQPTSRKFRVMTFNILQGGEEARNVGFDNSLFGGSRFDEIAAVIQLAKADIVGVQEDCSSEKLLKALGADWQRIGNVYSRLPLKRVSVESFLTTVELQLSNERKITLVNCHWFPLRNGYGPDLAQAELRADPTLKAPVAMADRIVAKCAVPNGARGYNATLKPIREALEASNTVILTGDFNEPSHLDWSDKYSRTGADRWVENPTGTPLRFAVPWPGSKALEALRMNDSYRAIYSDEVTHPGITWTPKYPEKTPGRRPYGEQCLDRIDRIYHSSERLKPLSAQIVGENDPANNLVFPGRWPSDHRAVVVEFELN